MTGGSRFTVNPFSDLVLDESARTQLVEIVRELVMDKFAEYQEHINNQKCVDEARWKKYSKEGNTTMFLERKKANPDSKLPALLMVGPLPGSLDENMFGCIPKKLSFITPDLELVRRKITFCAKCLLEATQMDTEEAARTQFVYKHTVVPTIYGSSGRCSDESSRTDSTMDVLG
ncbi:hypothetical protein PRIC1_004987 [Phytophthora ramorum]|uniref:uncharacterized protein n=1 Tax=Phytophthora ramorum TaxID=164328 RepID=UPI003098E342|nr:hypothetical protein KRP23_4729 [Phytophthora ramorum]